MVDFEEQIYTQIKKALGENVYTSSEYEFIPRKFPHVTISEVDNSLPIETFDSGVERFQLVTYEVNVYTNNARGKKKKAKELNQTVANEMYAMGFTRNLSGPVPNRDDISIHRILSRYTAQIDIKNNIVYRR